MQAIILAAGMGKRLKSLTANNTKCMVEVNGITLIERTLSQLDALDLDRIILVVGYEGQKLIDFVSTLEVKTPIIFVENPVYDKTNNIYSLALAKDYLVAEDTLLLESDLIFEDEILRELVDDPRPTLTLVDKYESWMDGTVVKLYSDDSIEAFVPGKRMDYTKLDSYYKTVNIYKFSKDFSRTQYVPFLEAYLAAQGNNEYYEQVLRVITILDQTELKAKRLNGQRWYEIDDVQDLDIAESIFTPDPVQKLQKITARRGGYWRYPKIVDFFSLVNPYFPPARLLAEMKASFDELFTQYPSDLEINSLLASKLYGVKREKILAGNGADELIKELVNVVEGKVGVVRPSFMEYPKRLGEERMVAIEPANSDFSYTADDLIEFFGNRSEEDSVGTLVLINPDCPSGNYLPKKDMLRLAEWTEANDIRLIVDETFADFASEDDASLIDDETLEAYPHLVVIKSISRSHGIPGVRLGVLASANIGLIQLLKLKVSLWNINSFGEFYLQIAEKYKADHAEALAQLKRARGHFYTQLATIDGLRPIPSEANYFMIELTNGISATTLASRLLDEYNLLVKDLSDKIDASRGQFIRIAIRREEDNDQLVSALRTIMQ